jgi:tetratricopeptide (TPR) repeat protein
MAIREVVLHPGFSLVEWDMNVRGIAANSILHGIVAAIMLMLVVTFVAAQGTKPQPTQTTKLKNVDLCNDVDRTSVESQTSGCTTLIESGLETPQTLVIAYNNRGNAYIAKGKYDLAIKDYDESIKLNPNYFKTYNNRGVAYKKKGEYDRAIADFDASIKINPEYANAFANRAETYVQKGDYTQALKDFDEAIRLQPTLVGLWNGRCWTRTMIGDLQAALTDCNEAIRLQPNAATFDSRGVTYLKLGQWELAIADFNSALGSEPRLASSLYGRGFAKLKKGDMPGGNADIAAANKTDQNIAGEFARYGIN